jgi:hypothetical protein
MPRHSRKAKLMKKRRARLRRMGAPLDEMHRALGEFLTECGRVEFLMVIFADHISDASIEAIFHDLSGPFGPKIASFKQWCDFSGVSEEQKPILDRVYKNLGGLLPKRNFLVHGETHEVTGGGRSQPYRIGINKKDMDYLDEFERGERGKNVFDMQQVKAATRLCREIYTDLHTLRYGDPPT